jgi:hypothetical protein
LKDDGITREFDTGATRDTAENKPEYAGYLSPLVLKRFGDYMLLNQTQSDGTKRASDNWQNGMPLTVYEQSLMRHVMDVWLHLRGYGVQAREDLQTALCGVLFNAQGLLYEELIPPSRRRRHRKQ